MTERSMSKMGGLNLPVKIKYLTEKKMIFSVKDESIVFTGKLFDFIADKKVSCVNSQCNEPYTIFSVEMKMNEETFLSEISWLKGSFDNNITKIVHSTSLNDNFLFIRKNNTSFIFSLDFPYSKIAGFTISYEPHALIKKEDKYIPYSMTVTACHLSGCMIGDFDVSEIEAVSNYIENRFPLRFDRPMYLATGITNRMTDVREGRVFYSMYDNPTVTLDVDTILREIDLCEELNIEYYQIFEGVFDWIDVEKTSKKLKIIEKYATSKAVKTGDYVHPGELYCPHYNYEHRVCEEADWRIITAEGNSAQLCLGCSDYLKYIKNQLVNHNREHNEKLICFDMINIVPCYNEKHNHPQGDVYKQVLGLVEIMQALNNLSGDYMCWTNSGNWIEFMPKLVWYNQNIYLTDPHPREYIPTLSTLKYLGDSRREQMVTVHEKYMVPYRFFTNCEYYFAPRSRISDIRTYEYSLLQSLAVTPNVCFGELRTFIERMPYKEVSEFKDFLKKWLTFINENYRYWKKTLRCGDAPGVGAVEVYSHFDVDSGFLCLVNQNTYTCNTNIKLDESIGLIEGKEIELFEVYPRECFLSETEIPFSVYGEQIKLVLPPESVRYIKVSPYKKKSGLTVYGAESRYEKTKNGHRIYLKEEQGTTKKIAIVTDNNEKVVSVNAYHTPSVKMFTFDADAKLIKLHSNIALIDVKFPRLPAVKEISSWMREESGETIHLPRPGFGFMGGLVSGAFSEKLEICLEIQTKINKSIPSQIERIVSIENNNNSIIKLTHNKIEILSTEFIIPFIEPLAYGSQPSYDYDSVMHLVFDDFTKINKIKAWLNEDEVEVKKYKNAMKKEWVSYYIELTGNLNPGVVKMKMEIEWKK